MNPTSSGDHDRDLAEAFDGQAARFERAPVQTDPLALGRLVREAALPAGSLVFDAGCGPGLVSRAFLEAGHRVVGVDLSAEMVARARARCSEFGPLAQFERQSIFDPPPGDGALFDASLSRYVLHHVADPAAFIGRQAELIRPGGTLVLSDHVTDPDGERAAIHNEIERLRDRTHTANLDPGTIVNLLARAGLAGIRMSEEAFTLDFDEWFGRGTPTASRDEVRARLLAAPPIRGFTAVDEKDEPGGRVTIHCWRAIVRATVPLVPDERRS